MKLVIDFTFNSPFRINNWTNLAFLKQYHALADQL